MGRAGEANERRGGAVVTDDGLTDELSISPNGNLHDKIGCSRHSSHTRQLETKSYTEG